MGEKLPKLYPYLFTERQRSIIHAALETEWEATRALLKGEENRDELITIRDYMSETETLMKQMKEGQ